MAVNYMNRNQQRLLERNNRQEQLQVPTSIRGKMRCPTCKGERRSSFIEFLFNGEKPQLQLTIVCINTRCNLTNGRPKVITFDLVELNDEGEPITTDNATKTTLLDKLIKDNMKLKSPKDQEPDLYLLLTGIKGIGRKLATKVIEAGYTAKSLKNARTVELQRLGMTTKQATIVIDAFQ